MKPLKQLYDATANYIKRRFAEIMQNIPWALPKDDSSSAIKEQHLLKRQKITYNPHGLDKKVELASVDPHSIKDQLKKEEAKEPWIKSQEDTDFYGPNPIKEKKDPFRDNPLIDDLMGPDEFYRGSTKAIYDAPKRDISRVTIKRMDSKGYQEFAKALLETAIEDSSERYMDSLKGALRHAKFAGKEAAPLRKIIHFAMEMPDIFPHAYKGYKIDMEISSLEEGMAKAVKKEDYEKAATIRDNLKLLEIEAKLF